MEEVGWGQDATRDREGAFARSVVLGVKVGADHLGSCGLGARLALLALAYGDLHRCAWLVLQAKRRR